MSNKLKIKLNKKSRSGNERPFGLLIVNCPSNFAGKDMQDMNYQIRELLNESIDKRSNCILTFGSGVRANFIRLG